VLVQSDPDSYICMAVQLLRHPSELERNKQRWGMANSKSLRSTAQRTCAGAWAWQIVSA
jgi:hypothetical protein